MKHLSRALVVGFCIAGVIVNTALRLHDGLNDWLELGVLFALVLAL